jgi:hypothetical protein
MMASLRLEDMTNQAISPLARRGIIQEKSPIQGNATGIGYHHLNKGPNLHDHQHMIDDEHQVSQKPSYESLQRRDAV